MRAVDGVMRCSLNFDYEKTTRQDEDLRTLGPIGHSVLNPFDALICLDAHCAARSQPNRDGD